MIKWGMNYQESVDFIFGHTNYEMVPRVPHSQETYDLRRLLEVLALLDNPHLKARSLHITGTNGKGSTSAMLASILTTAGLKTGLYTSPHLLTMRERFTIDGTVISEEEAAELTTLIRPKIEEVNARASYGRLTVFEILTLLSFIWFARQDCEWQVMEVGMGGRFDATNVVQPEVCFITAISYDHMEVLGDTLTKIAGEKCGIIKPGCVVISHALSANAEAKSLPARMMKKLNLFSPFMVAGGRLIWLKLPLTITLGVRRDLKVLLPAVMISSVIWDATYVLVGVLLGNLHTEPPYLILYSLSVLTFVYGTTFLVRRFLTWRALRTSKST